MKVLTTVMLLVVSLFLFSSCHGPADNKRSMIIGMDADHYIKDIYEGSGWNGMSKLMASVEDPSGTIKLKFLADEGYYSQLSTQHYSIWISGTVRQLDPHWNYCLWDLKISSKIPFELVFSGFQNTNGFKTNEDGMVLDCAIGETNVVFTNQLVLVYERETNSARN